MSTIPSAVRSSLAILRSVPTGLVYPGAERRFAALIERVDRGDDPITI